MRTLHEQHALKVKSDFNSYNGSCVPLLVYLGLSLLTLIGYSFSKHTLGATALYLFLTLLLIFIISYIIFYLCKRGYCKVAWFILFIPLIFELIWVIIIATIEF